MRSIDALPKLKGTTVVLVDVSGSMDAPLAKKSDMSRIDAAAMLGCMIDGARVFSFSNQLVEVPAYKGLAGVEAVVRSQPHSGTAMASAIDIAQTRYKADRIIVISDEQATDGRVVAPMAYPYRYMINVASYKNGVGYGAWTHIDGFSENVIRYIHELENAE